MAALVKGLYEAFESANNFMYDNFARGESPSTIEYTDSEGSTNFGSNFGSSFSRDDIDLNRIPDLLPRREKGKYGSDESSSSNYSFQSPFSSASEPSMATMETEEIFKVANKWKEPKASKTPDTNKARNIPLGKDISKDLRLPPKAPRSRPSPLGRGGGEAVGKQVARKMNRKDTPSPKNRPNTPRYGGGEALDSINHKDTPSPKNRPNTPRYGGGEALDRSINRKDTPSPKNRPNTPRRGGGEALDRSISHKSLGLRPITPNSSRPSTPRSRRGSETVSQQIAHKGLGVPPIAPRSRASTAGRGDGEAAGHSITHKMHCKGTRAPNHILPQGMHFRIYNRGRYRGSAAAPSLLDNCERSESSQANDLVYESRDDDDEEEEDGEDLEQAQEGCVEVQMQESNRHLDIMISDLFDEFSESRRSPSDQYALVKAGTISMMPSEKPDSPILQTSRAGGFSKFIRSNKINEEESQENDLTTKKSNRFPWSPSWAKKVVDQFDDDTTNEDNEEEDEDQDNIATQNGHKTKKSNRFAWPQIRGKKQEDQMDINDTKSGEAMEEEEDVEVFEDVEEEEEEEEEETQDQDEDKVSMHIDTEKMKMSNRSCWSPNRSKKKDDQTNLVNQNTDANAEEEQKEKNEDEEHYQDDCVMYGNKTRKSNRFPWSPTWSKKREGQTNVDKQNMDAKVEEEAEEEEEEKMDHQDHHAVRDGIAKTKKSNRFFWSPSWPKKPVDQTTDDTKNMDTKQANQDDIDKEALAGKSDDKRNDHRSDKSNNGTSRKYSDDQPGQIDQNTSAQDGGDEKKKKGLFSRIIKRGNKGEVDQNDGLKIEDNFDDLDENKESDKVEKEEPDKGESNESDESAKEGQIDEDEKTMQVKLFPWSRKRANRNDLHGNESDFNGNEEEKKLDNEKNKNKNEQDTQDKEGGKIQGTTLFTWQRKRVSKIDDDKDERLNIEKRHEDHHDCQQANKDDNVMEEKGEKNVNLFSWKNKRANHSKKESQNEEQSHKDHDDSNVEQEEGGKKFPKEGSEQEKCEKRQKQRDGDKKRQMKAESKRYREINKDVKQANRRVFELNEEANRLVFAQPDKRMMSTTLFGKHLEVEDEDLKMKLEQIHKIKAEEARRIKAMRKKQAITLFGGGNSDAVQKIENKVKKFHKRIERSKSRRDSEGEGVADKSKNDVEPWELPVPPEYVVLTGEPRGTSKVATATTE